MSNYKNLIFVDKSIKDYQVFFDSVNPNTFPILYSNDTKESILELIQSNFTTIDRIAFVFTSELNTPKLFLDNKFYNDDENISFVIDLIKNYNVKNVDYLGCNTLNYPIWTNYYDKIKETNVIIGASNDRTGNIKYGGDWILESTGEDIELIYFTNSIKYYKYLLDSTSSHTILIKNDNTIWGCGYNYYGQLGNTTNKDTYNSNSNLLPMDLQGKIPIAIACGNSHTIILMNNNTIWGCGYNNSGQLGNTTNVNTDNSNSNLLPMDLQGKIPIAITCGSDYTIILMNDNTIWGCGNNYFGQLGNTTNKDTNNSNSNLLPMDLQGKIPIAIACGSQHTIILMNDNTIWGCGFNYSGQLGNTINKDIFISNSNLLPMDLQGKIPIAITCGFNYSIILMNDNTIWGCGNNYFGQLGNTTNVNTDNSNSNLLPMDLQGKIPIAITCGSQYTIILMNDNTIWGCGFNYYGQLGNTINNNTMNSNSNLLPMDLQGKIPIAITCGSEYTIILTKDNIVYGCGNNYFGELGNGNTTDGATLVSMINGNNVKYIASMTTLPNIVSDICFLANTPIQTDQGFINIDLINTNIHTINSFPILYITKTISDTNYLVCIEKNALDNNIPSKQTIISPKHKIFYNGLLLPASSFLNKSKNIYKIEYNNEYLYNVLMEKQYFMNVNNLICETLNPNTSIAKYYLN